MSYSSYIFLTFQLNSIVGLITLFQISKFSLQIAYPVHCPVVGVPIHWTGLEY